MMGTVAYCPPEQISRGSADARSDVYSAGVVLFELLTGSTPYVGDSAMAVAYQHVNSDVPAPSSRRPGVPAQLDDVVLRATSREPSGRPLDAGALLAELHDVRLDLGLPVLAVPPRPRFDQPIDATQPIAAFPAGNPMSPVSPLAAPDEATTAPNPVAPVFEPLQHTVIGEGPITPGPPQSAQGQPVKPAKRPLSRKARARRRATIVVLIVLLLGALTGYGAWWLAVGRYHTVPQLSGLSQAAAIKQLTDGGFSVNRAVRQQFFESETIGAGTVLGTEPAAGSHLLSGKSVTLIVSKGLERYKVPPVSGTFDQAQQTLQSIPEVQVSQQAKADDSGKIAAGQVIGTNPAAGVSVKRRQAIVVYVSSGPPSVAVPDVTGKKKDDAEAKLTDAGFTVSFSDEYSDSVPEGNVISQNPGPGTAVKFSTVSVVVSKGPPLVTIPEIANGTNADDAKAQLQALGLKVKIDKQFGGFLNQVVAMDPKAGQQVPKGSEVKLTVV
jgi:serine/threonine-protein kinase